MVCHPGLRHKNLFNEISGQFFRLIFSCLSNCHFAGFYMRDLHTNMLLMFLKAPLLVLYFPATH